MLSALKDLLISSTVVFICVCVESGSFKIQATKSNLAEVNGTNSMHILNFLGTNLESSLNSLDSNKSNLYLEETVKNSSSRNILSSKPNDQGVHKTKVVSKEFALEGGGIGLPSQNLTVQSQDGGDFEEFHNKVSKGRKGVNFPGSSVVPRKGVTVVVNQLLDLSNTTSPIDTFTNGSLVINDRNRPTAIDGKAPPSVSCEITKTQDKVQSQETSNGILNITHSKKPEYVSDEKDVDEFDKYSIIKTSTTGEDYVIIGIVIVIGIWFSVFGALIFYRRAGEYWDRRHYRRMDFLVEGMYND